LNISVVDGERLSLEQIRRFLESSDELHFESMDRGGMYAWVGRTLVEQEYGCLGCVDKGVVRRYVAKMTGLNRAQTTRLVGQYRESGTVEARIYRRHQFASRYTNADIALLAEVDEARETLSGPATQRILYREHKTSAMRASSVCPGCR
jgi:hypothetical protein